MPSSSRCGCHWRAAQLRAHKPAQVGPAPRRAARSCYQQAPPLALALAVDFDSSSPRATSQRTRLGQVRSGRSVILVGQNLGPFMRVRVTRQPELQVGLPPGYYRRFESSYSESPRRIDRCDTAQPPSLCLCHAEYGELCHGTSEPESMPKKGQAQLRPAVACHCRGCQCT